MRNIFIERVSDFYSLLSFSVILHGLARLHLTVVGGGTVKLIGTCLLPFSSLVRLVEPSFPFLQLVPGLPHALCLLLHGVRGICRLEEGTNFVRKMRKPSLKFAVFRSRTCLFCRGLWHECTKPSCCCCCSPCSFWASCGWHQPSSMTTLPGRVSMVSSVNSRVLRDDLLLF